jgi:Ca-activated chloride channel homolog
METTGGDLNRDIVIAYHLSRPRTGLDVITSRTKDEDGYFCMTLTAGEELAQLNTGMDYVFILDISGSMAHGGKLVLSRGSLEAFIKALGEQDRFEVVTFNVQPNPLFRGLLAADEKSKAEAAEFLAARRPAGGTVLEPALSTAYKYRDPDRPLNVVVLSDGLTEQGEARVLLQMIRSRPENVRVFCIGVGNDVNRPLLEQLADDSGGLAAFISQGDSFDRQAQAFRRKLTRPVADDLKITFDGSDVFDVEPVRLPNLYHGTPVRLYGRYRGQGTVKALVQAQVDGRELKMPFEIKFPQVDPANPEIERMWAWHKVQRLLKEADAGGSRGDAVLSQIVNLGQTYSIVTEYTSFLVLENDEEYKRWKIERRNASRIARDRRPQQELQAELERIRAKAVADIGPEAIAAPFPAGAASSPRSQAQAPRPDVPQELARNTPDDSGPRRGWNVDIVPGRGSSGSGAIDPVTFGMAVLLAGAALLAGRGRAVRK